jgi:cell division protein FtsQ
MPDFSQRRRHIRQQKQLQFLQKLWQFLAVSGVTALALWVSQWQEWHLRSPQQIVVIGNRYIPTQELQAVVPVSYPQSIFQIDPQAIASQLLAVAPAEQVVVSRSVLPARLTIEIKERLPVAVSSRGGQVGYLDRYGVWLPQTSYPSGIPRPALTVLEQSDRPIPYWTQLYAQVQNSPVPIQQIDARNLPNLILSTELGTIHCGSYRPELFAVQLQAIANLKQLPATIDRKAISFFDLRDPSAPIAQTTKSTP